MMKGSRHMDTYFLQKVVNAQSEKIDLLEQSVSTYEKLCAAQSQRIEDLEFICGSQKKIIDNQERIIANLEKAVSADVEDSEVQDG